MSMKKSRNLISFRIACAAFIAVLSAGLALPFAHADEHEREAMRQAVERGEIRPLADILAAVRGTLPGEVVGVEAERKHGRWLYEFRVVDSQGRLFKVYVDAHSATIEQTRQK